jgi:hypothetical protein
MTTLNEGENQYIASTNFYQCRKLNESPEERLFNKLKKEKVYVEVVCEDGRIFPSKLQGCDITKAKMMKKRCKPHKKKSNGKTKRDCEALKESKRENCRNKQGLN